MDKKGLVIIGTGISMFVVAQIMGPLGANPSLALIGIAVCGGLILWATKLIRK